MDLEDSFEQLAGIADCWIKEGNDVVIVTEISGMISRFLIWVRRDGCGITHQDKKKNTEISLGAGVEGEGSFIHSLSIWVPIMFQKLVQVLQI